MNGLTYKAGWNDEHKLLLKMTEIMGDVGAIPKTGFNKYHNYPYHTEADINKAFQVLFSQKKLVLMPSLESSEMRTTTTRADKIEYIQKARMIFTIMDAETGESLSGHMEGEGQDVGDKALYKSISGTQKYFLMKTFMIQDQNDPEADEGVDERNADKPSVPPPQTNTQHQRSGQTGTAPSSNIRLVTEGQSKMLYAKAKAAEVGLAHVSDFLKYEVKDFKQVHMQDVNNLIKMLDETKAKLDNMNPQDDGLPF